jgi:hypothetical protein
MWVTFLLRPLTVYKIPVLYQAVICVIIIIIIVCTLWNLGFGTYVTCTFSSVE